MADVEVVPTFGAELKVCDGDSLAASHKADCYVPRMASGLPTPGSARASLGSMMSNSSTASGV